jgi:hypothetical protein
VTKHTPDAEPDFVEIENDPGKSLEVGEWRERPDGLSKFVLE